MNNEPIFGAGDNKMAKKIIHGGEWATHVVLGEVRMIRLNSVVENWHDHAFARVALAPGRHHVHVEAYKARVLAVLQAQRYPSSFRSISQRRNIADTTTEAPTQEGGEKCWWVRRFSMATIMMNTR